MASLTLVIGNKNYSSWSLRPWLLLKHAGIPFAEICIPLNTRETHERITQYSPSGRVPVLLDGAVRVWEALAICEHIAERFPEARGWPTDQHARAIARSVATEMHAGFSALRAGGNGVRGEMGSGMHIELAKRVGDAALLPTKQSGT